MFNKYIIYCIFTVFLFLSLKYNLFSQSDDKTIPIDTELGGIAMPPPQYFDSLLSTIKLEYSVYDQTLQKEDVFENMKRTRWLGIYVTDFKKIPIAVWENLRALEIYIHLGENQKLPIELYKAKNTRILRVYGKQFNDFPLGLSNLNKLDSLTVETEAPVINFNGELKSLPYLRSIKICLLKNQKIPEEITQLSSLTNLYVQIGESQAYYSFDNTKTSSHLYILDDLHKLTNLEKLSLSGDSDSIIVNRKNLPNYIKSIEIEFRRVYSLPNELFSVETLQNIFIKCDKIKEIPSYIYKLKKLRDFSFLAYNPDAVFPVKISKQLLTKPTLNTLRIRNNCILENGIYPQIQWLEVNYGYNGGIEMFPNLKKLVFNEIRKRHTIESGLPKLNTFTKLEVLKFIKCDINVFPVGIENLLNLKHLSFYESNELRGVSDEFINNLLDKLPNLEELDIRSSLALKGKYLTAKYPKIKIKYRSGIDFEPFKY